MPTPRTRDEMAAMIRQHYPALAPHLLEHYIDLHMATQARELREPWRHLTFDQTTQARGRNGWFALHEADLDVYPEDGYLHLYGKVRGKQSPIVLHFRSPADMRTLGEALLQGAEAWEAQTAPPLIDIPHAHRCPQCVANGHPLPAVLCFKPCTADEERLCARCESRPPYTES